MRGLGISLGLRANVSQFSILVGVTGLVEAMDGKERSLLPLLATNVFGLTGASATVQMALEPESFNRAAAYVVGDGE